MKWLMILMLVLGSVAMATAQSSAFPVVRWSTFRTGTSSNIKNFQTRVIHTEGQFQMFWRELTGDSPSSAPRDINWAREEIWVIALGERRTGGHSVMVRSVQFVNPQDIEVLFFERAPQPGQMVTQALTHPYIILRVERSAGRPKFVRGEDPGFAGGTIITGPGWIDHGPTPVRWGILDRGFFSNVNGQQHFTLQTRREYLEHVRNAFPGQRDFERMADDVDWRDEMVVALYLGRRGVETRVEVESVLLEKDGRLWIRWFEESDRSPAARVCNPYLLMRVPRISTAPVIRKTFGRPIR